jgi:hypothetical protein
VGEAVAAEGAAAREWAAVAWAEAAAADSVAAVDMVAAGEWQDLRLGPPLAVVAATAEAEPGPR